MEDNVFDGAGLEEALASGALETRGIVVVGMVRSADGPGFVAFTRTGCETWVNVPIAMIESAERIGTQPCKDHAHPVMRITLKEPQDPVGKVLAALLAEPMGARMAPMMTAGADSRMGGAPMGMGRGPGASMSQGYGARMMGDGYDAMNGGPGAAPRAAMRQGGQDGLGGHGGGLGAWGCWDSTCSTCVQYIWVCGPTGCRLQCAVYGQYDCERCIWPY